MSLWHSYRNLAPRTRLLLGGGIIVYAAAGLFLSDQAERYFDMTPSARDRQALKEAVPRVRVVEREK